MQCIGGWVLSSRLVQLRMLLGLALLSTAPTTAEPARSAWQQNGNLVADSLESQISPLAFAFGTSVLVAWLDSRRAHLPGGTSGSFYDLLGLDGSAAFSGSGMAGTMNREGARNEGTLLAPVADSPNSQFAALCSVGEIPSGGAGLFATLIEGSGTRLWNANSPGLGTVDPLTRCVAASAAGEVVVGASAPEASPRSVRLFRFLTDGTADPAWPIDGLRVGGPGLGDQVLLALVDAGAGRTFVFWATTQLGVPVCLVQLLEITGGPAVGWPSAGVVVASDLKGRDFQACRDGSGGAYCAWVDNSLNFQGLASHIRAQRVSGDPLAPLQWSPIEGVLASSDTAFAVSLDWSASGGLAIAWRNFGFPLLPQSTDVHCTRIRPNGDIAVGFPPGGLPVCQAIGEQSDVVIAATSDSSMVIAWADARSGGAMPRDVFAARVSGDATIQTPAEGLVLSDAPLDQTQLACADDGQGGALVLWHDPQGIDNSSIRAQRLTELGTLLGVGSVQPVTGALRVTLLHSSSSTECRFSLTTDTPSTVLLTLFDPQGRVMRSARHESSGLEEVVRLDLTTNAGGLLDPGIYFLRLELPRDEARAVLHVPVVR